MLSRRKFLIKSGLGLASTSVFLSASQLVPSNEQGILIGPKRYNIRGRDVQTHYIGIENLFTGETVNITADGEGHSVIKHPLDPLRFVMLAQRPGTISTDLRFRKNGKHTVTGPWRSGAQGIRAVPTLRHATRPNAGAPRRRCPRARRGPSPHPRRVRPRDRRARRGHRPSSSKVLRVGELMVDLERYDVTVSGRRVSLTYKEFQLLVLLASNPGRVYTSRCCGPAILCSVSISR